jgi:hypothetical protein
LSSLSPSTNNDDDDDKNDDIQKIDVNLRLKKNVAQVGRLIAKHNDEDFDKFISEEVSKIILALVEASSLSISMSDELKEQMQSHLKDEKI